MGIEIITDSMVLKVIGIEITITDNKNQHVPDDSRKKSLYTVVMNLNTAARTPIAKAKVIAKHALKYTVYT